MTCKDCICYEACKHTLGFERLDQSIDAREWCPIFEHKEEYKKIIHAHWSKRKSKIWSIRFRCSNCNCINHDNGHFCSNCGAKMDEVDYG